MQTHTPNAPLSKTGKTVSVIVFLFALGVLTSVALFYGASSLRPTYCLWSALLFWLGVANSAVVLVAAVVALLDWREQHKEIHGGQALSEAYSGELLHPRH